MVGSSESQSRARRAYVREDHEWNYPEDLSPEFLHGFHEHWAAVEEEIKALQDRKKTMLANVRTRYGRHRAETLKIAMRLMLLDQCQRYEQVQFHEAARHYVEVLEAEIEGRHFDA
ncbi:hypothetical protein [Aminobacter sp. BE322]|uniref:hypothetical protein n=1 Tax=unclassified Aminobacter TaxID=2644704 RepID=UPI003D1E4D0D